ncbi:hypothetical protein ABTN22_19055, partial [Acinetobacter baumannii]
DSLDFGSVYTTILGTKVMLGAAGFVLFTAATFLTLVWVRRSYSGHFDVHSLPPILQQRKKITWLFAGIAIAVGFVGSSVMQGLG